MTPGISFIHPITPVALALLHLCVAAPAANAATKYWYANDTNTTMGGNGTWDNTLIRFKTTTTGPANLAWDNSLTDTISLNTVASSITLGSDITLGGISVVAGGSTNAVGPGAGPYKLTLGVTGTNSFSVSTSTGRTLTISAEVAGVSGNNLTIATGTGTAGIVNLNAVNSYLGNTSVSGNGTLRMAGAGQLGSGSYSGTISIGGASNFNYASSADQTLSGPISGSGSLTKGTSASSTLTLGGNNSYTGTTSVNNGTLRLNGTHTGGGTYTVGVSGTLQGTGSTASQLDISGKLSPGASVQSFASGTLNLLDGSTFEYEMDSSAAASAGADLQVVAGDLNLTTTVGLTLGDLASIPTPFALGTTFSLINYSGAWNNGLFSFAGNAVADGGSITTGLNGWQIDYNAASGGLNFTGDQIAGSFVNITAINVIPEPRAALLAALGVLALLRRRRQ
jgi:autotransporter-associated beta strand protein